MFLPPLPLWLYKITQRVLKRNLEFNCGRNYVSGRRLKPPITNKSILSLNFAKPFRKIVAEITCQYELPF